MLGNVYELILSGCNITDKCIKKRTYFMFRWV
jgi:hypothetical protein